MAGVFEGDLIRLIGRRQDGGVEALRRRYDEDEVQPTVSEAVTDLMLACIRQGSYNGCELAQVEDGLEYAQTQVERALFAVRNAREDATRR